MYKEALKNGYGKGDYEAVYLKEFTDLLDQYSKENDLTLAEAVEQMCGEGISYEAALEYQERFLTGMGYLDSILAAKTFTEKFEQGDKTEEAFIELAKTYSEDTYTKSEGGLYADITPQRKESEYTEYDRWLYDSARQPGDYRLIEDESSGTILYFVSRGEPFWELWSRSQLLTEYEEQFTESILDKYPPVYPEDMEPQG